MDKCLDYDHVAFNDESGVGGLGFGVADERDLTSMYVWEDLVPVKYRGSASDGRVLRAEQEERKV